MNLEDAYQFLNLNSNSSDAERFAVYEEMRNKLEGKLAKAPTPGLKEKYRNSLKQMEEAIEVIEGSVDGGDLPTLSPKVEKTPASAPMGGIPPVPSASPAPTTSGSRRSHKKEVWVLAIVIAIVAFVGFRYWSGQAAAEGARVELASGLPELSAEVDAIVVRYGDLMGKRSLLGLTYGDELETMDFAQWESDMRNRLETAERSKSVQQWEVAMESVKIGVSGCEALNQKLDTSFKAIQADSERIEKDAVTNFLDNAWSAKLDKVRIALSSSLPLDVNQVHPELGFTALTKASFNENVELVSLLLSRPDIDVNKKNSDGESPLTVACRFHRENKKLINMLLARPDIDVNSISNDWDAALVTACIYNEIWLLRTLLARSDISVNITGRDFSPLMIACNNKHLEATRMLLDHPNISLNQRDSKGRTALNLAKSQSIFSPPVNPTIVSLLESRGAQE
jgi:hypothetical protein